MSKKRFFPLISTLICFAFSSEYSYALPQDPQIISGSAHIEKTDHVMEIRPSDQAILHYSKFNIGKGEQLNSFKILPLLACSIKSKAKILPDFWIARK